MLVRVTGGRPLAAQVYELERLRCGLCGAVFTAEPPAGVGDLFMSLIHTAELHQIGPFRYLVALQRHAAAVVLDPSAWMPWTYTQALAVAKSGLAATGSRLASIRWFADCRRQAKPAAVW